MSKNYSRPTPVCEEVTAIHLQGNIVPDSWCNHITMQHGKPDFLAIMILADVWYWYRLVIVKDEETNRVIGRRKKFKLDKLQKSYTGYSDQFGVSKDRVKESIDRLEGLRLVSREFRTITTEQGLVLTNVMFLEPIPVNIKEISVAHPRENTPPGGGGGSGGGRGGESTPPSTENTPQVGAETAGTYTESTTEISTDNFPEVSAPLRGKKERTTKTKAAKTEERQFKALLHPEQELIAWMKDIPNKPPFLKKWKLSGSPGGKGNTYQGPTASMMEKLLDQEKIFGAVFFRKCWLRFLKKCPDYERFPYRTFLDGFVEREWQREHDDQDVVYRDKLREEIDRQMRDKQNGIVRCVPAPG